MKMNPNKTPKRRWLNPLCWLQQIFAFVVALVADLLRLFGLVPPPATDGFENIRAADVEDAAAGAVAKEMSLDAASQQLSPAQIVLDYALASESHRAMMDLGKLSSLEQDWLLSLKEADLIVLGESGVGACARSLRNRTVVINTRRLRRGDDGLSGERQVRRLDDTDREADNRAYISARFRELMSATAGTEPHHETISLSRH